MTASAEPRQGGRASRFRQALVGLFLLPIMALQAHQAAAQQVSARAGAARAGSESRASTDGANDQAFIAARNAAVKMDERAFEAAAPGAAGHPLADYLEYWRLRMLLARVRASSPPEAVRNADQRAQAFVERHASELIGDLARRDWLLALGRRGAWAQVGPVAAGWVLKDDTLARCVIAQARAVRGEPVIEEARDLLLVPKDLGEACNMLLEHLTANGQADAEFLRTRLDRALESGSVSAIRRAALLALPTLDARQLESALAQPASVLQNPGTSRELALIASGVLARKEPLQMPGRLSQPGAASLRDPDRAGVLAIAAASAVRDLAPEAGALARMAQTAKASDELLGDLARAGLLVSDWALVRSAIERMSVSGQADATWSYWLARSLLAGSGEAESVHRARTLLTTIAGRAGFYSQLASEELGTRFVAPARAAAPTEDELASMRARRGFDRAARFYALGLRPEGHREWNFELRGMSDRQLMAAAEWGRQLGHLDRMVNSSDRTREEHDYQQRYPVPFYEQLQPIAKAQGLDAAWVYGLIRQESRFMMTARSSVGASGLMQIMPGTARWIANRLGERNFTPGQINDLDTNLRFGTYYLRYVLDNQDGSPLLASAGYNAGPGRPRAWRGRLTKPLEGAAFAEIIPFLETRGYVKAVLANATVYSAVYPDSARAVRVSNPVAADPSRLEAPSLKTLLGRVNPGPAVASTPSPGG
ncbi:MAG: transglycosylase SLT domain-containing protein [Burkholderiaceae bacterium]